MNQTDFRVLYSLSRSLGTPLSVSVVAGDVEAEFGTGHYKNVHQAVERLTEAGYLRTEKSGRTKLVSLNLAYSETVDILAEVDFRARRESRNRPISPVSPSGSISDLLQREPGVGTAFLVDAEVNRALNRRELVVAVRDGDGLVDRGEPPSSPDLSRLHDRIDEEARRANVSVDALVVTESELVRGLTSRELHPVQVQAGRRTLLVDPQRFWWLVREAKREGLEPAFRPSPSGPEGPVDFVSPLAEPPGGLGPHLQRFGYTEMGSSDEPVEEVCLEVALAGALGSEEPRHRYASAVLLADNDPNPRLLAFLARRHGLSALLLGIVDAVRKRTDLDGLDEVEDFLPPDTEPAEVDQRQVDEMLSLYG